MNITFIQSTYSNRNITVEACNETKTIVLSFRISKFCVGYVEKFSEKVSDGEKCVIVVNKNGDKITYDGDASKVIFFIGGKEYEFINKLSPESIREVVSEMLWDEEDF